MLEYFSASGLNTGISSSVSPPGSLRMRDGHQWMVGEMGEMGGGGGGGWMCERNEGDCRDRVASRRLMQR